MGIFPNARLLLRMLTVIGGIFILIVTVLLIANITNTTSPVFLVLPFIIPVGFISFILYKFGKVGAVAVLYFLGGASVLFGILTLFVNIYEGISGLIIGIIFVAISTLLRRTWKIKKRDMHTKGARG